MTVVLAFVALAPTTAARAMFAVMLVLVLGRRMLVIFFVTVSSPDDVVR